MISLRTRFFSKHTYYHSRCGTLSSSLSALGPAVGVPFGAKEAGINLCFVQWLADQNPLGIDARQSLRPNILLCSREHAPCALQQYGFRALIAPSFADIFYNNCFKNGLLPIVLTEQHVDHLFNETHAFNGFQLTIELDAQVVRKTDGSAKYKFEVDAFRKYRLLNGFDDIGLTLRQSDKIRQFEAQRLTQQPWLNHRLMR